MNKSRLLPTFTAQQLSLTTANNYTEQELLRQIAAGDTAAYKQFFHQYYTPLVFFARTIIQQEADAEDLVQDAFVKIWSKRTSLVQQGNLRAFLYTMVKNTCLDYLRQLKRKTARQEEIQYLAQQDDSFLETAVLYEELLRTVAQEIEALPEKYGTILKMVFLEGHTYAEISEKLQLPEATIRKQKERALKQLNLALLRQQQLPLGAIAPHLIFLLGLVTKA